MDLTPEQQALIYLAEELDDLTAFVSGRMPANFVEQQVKNILKIKEE